jgi:hypothetical protein
MSDSRNKRVEQEINEILERKQLGSSDEPLPNRRYSSPGQKLKIGPTRGALGRVPPGILWLVGVFGFAILAILVADWWRNLAILFGILAILVVFSPIYFWSRPGPATPVQKEWRGRIIQMPPRQDGPLGRLKYKIWEFRNRSR